MLYLRSHAVGVRNLGCHELYSPFGKYLLIYDGNPAIYLSDPVFVLKKPRAH